MIKRIGNIVLIQLSDIDSNIYVAGDTAIDSGTGFNFTRLMSILRVLKMNMENIRHVINTHCHFDHIGGNGYFTEADVAIHEIDAPVIEKGDVVASYADFFDGKIHPRPVERKLREGDEIAFAGMTFKVIHTPGHTPGSICLYNGDKGILFSGDTVFSDGVGRTDMPGGDDDAMAGSLEKISKLDVKQMLPGHGDVVRENGNQIIKEMLDFAEEEAD
jgi:hydroxyacylglutathione hydrolase